MMLKTEWKETISEFIKESSKTAGTNNVEDMKKALITNLEESCENCTREDNDKYPYLVQAQHWRDELCKDKKLLTWIYKLSDGNPVKYHRFRSGEHREMRIVFGNQTNTAMIPLNKETAKIVSVIEECGFVPQNETPEKTDEAKELYYFYYSGGLYMAYANRERGLSIKLHYIDYKIECYKGKKKQYEIERKTGENIDTYAERVKAKLVGC